MEKAASIAFSILLVVGVEWAAVEYKQSKEKAPAGKSDCGPALASEAVPRSMVGSNQATMLELNETDSR